MKVLYNKVLFDEESLRVFIQETKKGEYTDMIEIPTQAVRYPIELGRQPSTVEELDAYYYSIR